MALGESGLSDQARGDLLALARASVQHGLCHGCALTVDETNYSPALRAIRSTFVTLRLNDDLRGCIGALEARLPLVQDVADNAYAAAFRDPRFAPLQPQEFAGVGFHISVLSPPQPLPVTSLEQLYAELRPGIDGVVLYHGERRATFLPAVWESLPQVDVFIGHLMGKAGLPEDYWSAELRFEVYTTESF